MRTDGAIVLRADGEVVADKEVERDGVNFMKEF